MATNKRKAAPRKAATPKALIAPPLSYSAAFAAMDLIEDAMIDLEGSFEIFEQISANMSPKYAECGWFITLERHFKADRAQLAENITKARKAILDPLFKAGGRNRTAPPGMEWLLKESDGGDQ